MRKRLAKAAACLAAMMSAVAVPAAIAQLPEPEYDETVELMELVSGAAALVSERGLEAACAEFSEPGEWFQDELYVFVFDMEGNAVCHPALPTLQGQKLLELRDPVGKPIIQSFLRELEGGRDTGWVHYLWPRPGSSAFRWKTSHVRRARTDDGTEYIVGSGLYEMPMERFFVVEQVNDAIELLRAEGEDAFYTLRDRTTGFRFYDAYVFVLDPDGIMLVNVAFPALENSNVALMQDQAGKMIGQEFLAVPLDQAAWIDYLWPKPGEEKVSRKSTYVRRIEVEGREYIVAAGVYF